MTRKHGLFFFVLLAAVLIAAPSWAANPPHLFFTDLNSGPATGGEGGNGAYVRVYGNFLGSSQSGSTITLNGTPMVNIKEWGTVWETLPDGGTWVQRITAQIAAGSTSGDIVVTVNGQASNPIPFTVRPGNIYFVAPAAHGGSNSNAGTFVAPWLTLNYAVQNMAAEGIVYAETGTDQTVDGGGANSSALALEQLSSYASGWCGPGPNGYPRALLTYPGATVQIGDINGTDGSGNANGIRTTGPQAGPNVNCIGYWTIGEFVLRGGVNGGAVLISGPSSHWRLIGNDISCPYGNGASACVHTALYWNNFHGQPGGDGSVAWPTNCQYSGNNYCVAPNDLVGAIVNGNKIHDVGVVGAMSEYHSLYFGTDSRHSWAGWNLIWNGNGCRGIETNSSVDISGSGTDIFDLHFHDNVIHDVQCDGIDFNDTNPGQGAVEAYNNVIYNTGQGHVVGGGGFSCIAVSGAVESVGQAPSGATLIYNNTFYNCGNFASPPYESNAVIHNGGHGPNVYAEVVNSIWYQNSNGNGSDPTVYWFDELNGNGIKSSTNNILFGLGTPLDCNFNPSCGYTNAHPGPSVESGLSFMFTNPNFVSTSLPDFHLQANSPAIGAGTTAPNTLSYDIEGKARPANMPAIGALEFASSSTPTPPAPPTNLTVTVH